MYVHRYVYIVSELFFVVFSFALSLNSYNVCVNINNMQKQ